MNKRFQASRNRQRGVATLITSLMVLFVITLITLYATQSTVMETSVSANQYRADQSFAAANGAMDYAEARFADVGVDSDGGGTADCTQAAPCNFNIASGNQTLAARYFFCDPDQLDPAGTGAMLTGAQVLAGNTCTTTNARTILGAKGGRYENQVGIVAVGFSDDNTAQRVMIKAAAVAPAIANGPGSPLSNGGAVGLTGNMRVINRFSDFTIWSGKDVGTKGSADTYTASGTLTGNVCQTNYPLYRDNPTDATYSATQAACVQYPTSGNIASLTNAKLTTDKAREANFDIVDNDPNLDNLIPSPDPVATNILATPDNFWDNFMSLSKADIRAAAEKAGQLYTGNATIPAGTVGYVWVDGLATISDDVGNVGGRKSILLVAGNGVKITGSNFVYGIIYVMGTWTVQASPTIQGAVITRGPTSGAGSPVVVYDPSAFDNLGGGLSGAVVGSWRDW